MCCKEVGKGRGEGFDGKAFIAAGDKTLTGFYYKVFFVTAGEGVKIAPKTPPTWICQLIKADWSDMFGFAVRRLVSGERRGPVAKLRLWCPARVLAQLNYCRGKQRAMGINKWTVTALLKQTGRVNRQSKGQERKLCFFGFCFFKSSLLGEKKIYNFILKCSDSNTSCAVDIINIDFWKHRSSGSIFFLLFCFFWIHIETHFNKVSGISAFTTGGTCCNPEE